MTKKKQKFDFEKLKGVLPYFVAGLITLALVFVGSLNKNNSDTNFSLDTFAANDYKISVDQLSELYVVADLSDALNLASAQEVASNYVVTTTLYDSGQTSVGKLEKPNLTDVGEREWVISYTVGEGESMESIANKYGITTDQIRWSNGLKNTDVAAGTVLYIPKEPGIIYTVKADDTIESIASTYGSNVEEITIFNDLDVSELAEGNKIFIKGGSLPEKERPEYVPPVVRPTYTQTTTYTYTYLGNSSSRENVQVIATGFFDASYGYPNPNPGVPGWCTWYAWYWRATSPLSLGTLGHEGRNANTWHINYAYRGVGRTPAVGAVFQSPYGGGGFGHVGVVVGMNDDGSITVQEMNYAGRYVVTQATIPASAVGNFNYIY